MRSWAVVELNFRLNLRKNKKIFNFSTINFYVSLFLKKTSIRSFEIKVCRRKTTGCLCFQDA